LGKCGLSPIVPVLEDGKVITSGLFEGEHGSSYRVAHISRGVGFFTSLLGREYLVRLKIKNNAPELDVTNPMLIVRPPLRRGRSPGTKAARVAFFHQ